MKDVICHGGVLLQCQWGMIVSPLKVTPTTMVTASKLKVANIMDHIPFLNISSFGMCRSLLNPMTVITPVGIIFGPCIPNTPAPWLNPSMKVKVNHFPAITPSSKCLCVQGLGQIKILNTTFPRVKVG